MVHRKRAYHTNPRDYWLGQYWEETRTRVFGEELSRKLKNTKPKKPKKPTLKPTKQKTITPPEIPKTQTEIKLEKQVADLENRNKTLTKLAKKYREKIKTLKKELEHIKKVAYIPPTPIIGDADGISIHDIIGDI